MDEELHQLIKDEMIWWILRMNVAVDTEDGIDNVAELVADEICSVYELVRRQPGERVVP